MRLMFWSIIPSGSRRPCLIRDAMPGLRVGLRASSESLTVTHEGHDPLKQVTHDPLLMTHIRLASNDNNHNTRTAPSFFIHDNNNNNNNNNNNKIIIIINDNVYGAILMTMVTARVHPVHLMNAD